MMVENLRAATRRQKRTGRLHGLSPAKRGPCKDVQLSIVYFGKRCNEPRNHQRDRGTFNRSFPGGPLGQSCRHFSLCLFNNPSGGEGRASVADLDCRAVFKLVN